MLIPNSWFISHPYVSPLAAISLFSPPLCDPRQTAAHQASLSITNSHLCSLPNSWEHLSLLSPDKQTSSCRLWGKCIPRKPLLPGFHGKLPSAEKQGSHSESQEQTDGNCPNAINKRKNIYFHLSFFLFPFSRVTCNHGPHLGHFGEHSMWILVCKDHSVYIDWPVQQYTDQYNFLHLNGVHDFLHW